MDHSKMNYGPIQHGANQKMGMAGHDHHKMMIADFRKRFYIIGYNLCIKSKLRFIALIILMFSH